MQAALLTQSWDLSFSLRRRRRRCHALVLFLAALVALILFWLARTAPRHVSEGGRLQFWPQSGLYRLTISGSVEAIEEPLNGGGLSRRGTNSAVEASFGLPNGSSRSFIIAPATATFHYTSRYGGSEVTRAFSADDVRLWMQAEANLNGENPAIRQEAAEIASIVREIEFPPAHWRVIEAAAIAHLPSFRLDGGSSDSSNDSVELGWRRPWLPGIPYLAAVLAIEFWYRIGRRRLRAIYGARSAAGRLTGRTLTIFFTDMKDYTARTSGKQGGEILDLIRDLRGVVAASIAARSGRIIKNVGDAFLVTFERGTDAVLAGVELQRAVRIRNASIPESEQFEMRVGISTGEVAEEGGDVFGPPVNVAARLQGIAEPGEVLFTEATFRALNPNSVAFERKGAVDLKGVPGTVVIYSTTEQRTRNSRVRRPVRG